MNEELRITIKTITNDAQKQLGAVKKELNGIAEGSKKTSKDIGVSMAAIKKGAGIAAGAIIALTTAMVSLGKSSQEYQKIQAQLNTAFQAAGSNAAQAAKTYEQMFRFLGESDTATEASNLLVKLTQDEQDLAQWTKILQGVYASFPDSLPIEALVESANETAKVGKVTGNLADALNWVGESEEAMNARLATTTSLQERERILRETLNGLYGNASRLYERNNSAMLAFNESQVKVDRALAQATAYVTPLLTEFNELAAVVLTVLKPAFETIAAVLIVFIQWITAAIQYVGAFFGIFSKDGVNATKTVQNNLNSISVGADNLENKVSGIGSAFKDATNQAAALRKQTMGFDELNMVSDPNISISSPDTYDPGVNGGGANIKIPTMGDLSFELPQLADFQKDLDNIKARMEGLLPLIGLAGVGFASWKLIGFINDLKESYQWLKTCSEIKNYLGNVDLTNDELKEVNDMLDEHTGKLNAMKSKWTKIGGAVLAVAGAVALVAGYTDAWATGVDWGNLALSIGGVAAAVLGLHLALGKVAGSIGAVVGGIALLVLGAVDFIKNGPTLENTILIIGGAVAIAVGLATGGISVLISAIVGAVAAIGTFVAAILLEEPAIMSVEEAQNNLTAAKQAAAEAEMGYVNAVDAAEASMNRLAAAEEAAGITGEELFAQVQSGTLDYANMTAEQKEVYKAYLDNEQKQKELEESTRALNEAKKAETIASYENQLALAKESGNYDDYKKSVIEAFENGELSAAEARDLIAKSMSEMSDDAQKTFMEDLPGDIKNGLDPHQYESTGTKMKKWFSNTWEEIKGFFSDVGEWFYGVGQKVGDAIASAFKTVVNWILEKVEDTLNIPFKMINGAIDIINGIPGVNITKLELISIPRLATGGITNGSTIANIGENGREAVLPLENNTGWMDLLADRINGRSGAPSRLVLMVDERELGYATIDGINGITKQTGVLPLVLA